MADLPEQLSATMRPAALPSVAIVGRANVGKSSLFNAICRERVAIVDARPGITRDRIAREITINERPIELVDTGGVGMESAQEIVDDVEMQIEIAIMQADLVLLVVDAQAGVHPLDKMIAGRLREGQKHTLVVANKSEREIDAQSAGDFYALGLGEPLLTAAAHRWGVTDLCERIVEELPESLGPAPDIDAVKLAIVGRRNVGKSTLINRLAREPRVVVSELPGTTRDSVDVRILVGETDFIVIDTAGVRRKKQINESVEFYSQVRTEAAVRRADVVVFMVDAPEEIGKVDKQFAAYIVDNYRPCVVAVNKIDRAGDVDPAQFDEYVHFHLPNLRFAPVVCISAQTGRRVPALLDMVQGLRSQALERVGTGALNRAMQEITTRKHPPSRGARPGNILYATQVGTEPPTIALFCNDSAKITPDYERYLANQLRQRMPFSSIPIRFAIRRRGGPQEEGDER